MSEVLRFFEEMIDQGRRSLRETFDQNSSDAVWKVEGTEEAGKLITDERSFAVWEFDLDREAFKEMLKDLALELSIDLDELYEVVRDALVERDMKVGHLHPLPTALKKGR
jgi:hypothetical protein